jgi:hypothetical protein
MKTFSKPPVRKTIPGINIQWPWSELIASGSKTVETRSYDIPEMHRGQELALIETPGPRGKREAGITAARIIGIVRFKKTYRYKTESAWLSETGLHQVPAGDKIYGFKKEKPKWAWVVESFTLINPPIPPPKKRGLVFATACKIAFKSDEV